MTRDFTTGLTTADLVDEHGDRVRVCETAFRQFGGERVFGGPIRTVSCYHDIGLLWDVLRTPGNGSVLVVDGGGSRRCALVGDMIAGSAVENGWSGLVINGSVRDSTQLAHLSIGIKALGTTPRRSGRAGTGVVDVSIGFGGIAFAPGDLLFADDDGVVLLPVDA